MIHYFIKIALKILSLLIITSSSTLIAQESEIYSFNIAIIQEDILLSETDVVKDLKLRLNEMIANNQTELSKTEKDLKTLEHKLKEQKNNLPANDVKANKAFEKELIDFNRILKSTQEDFRSRKSKIEKIQKDSMKKIREEITLILSDMSKEFGFQFVMLSHPFIWFDPKADITQEVLKRTNAKLKKLNF